MSDKHALTPQWVYSHTDKSGRQYVAYYEDEEFKPHPMNPRYLIGNRGTVYDERTEKIVQQRNTRVYEAIKTQKLNPTAYKQINFDGQTGLIHRLVMETFGPVCPIPSGIEVNHINGIKWDNVYFGPNDHRTNLELCTPKENKQKASQNGLVHRGEDHHNSLYKDSTVHRFCQLMLQGYTTRQIAEICGYPFTPQFSKNLCDIRNGRSYNHIGAMYPNLNAHIDGTKTRLSNEIVEQICILLVQGKTAPEIAEALGVPYGDGTRLRSIIQCLKNGTSHRNITSKYVLPYKKRS